MLGSSAIVHDGFYGKAGERNVAKVEIISHEGKTNIFLDDKQVKGASAFYIVQKAGDVPKLTLEFPMESMKLVSDKVELRGSGYAPSTEQH